MPARSCVAMTTRVASTSACSEGARASHCGSGYEPTTVVRMRAIAAIIIHQMVNTLPPRFADVEAFEEFMTRSTAELEADLAGIDEILVLGVGGKMGPTLARMARRAGKRVVGVARFSERGLRDKLTAWGIECLACDLLERDMLELLPRIKHVVFMAGHKFGAAGNPALTWAMNAGVPFLV